MPKTHAVMGPDFRKKVFSLQQRVAITHNEALALFAIVVILVVGSLVSHFDGRHVRATTAGYAALDSAMAAAARIGLDEAVAAQPAEEVDRAVAAAASGPAAAAPPRRRLAPVRIDPNTASAATLERLPGIGPALAGRVIAHREAFGPFRSARDLLAVRGIGPKTLERIEPYLHFGPAAAAVESGADQPEDESGGGHAGSSGSPSPR